MIKNNPCFDNRVFWDCRYMENPALGSGIGSRGENLLHKRAVITAFVERIAPGSVLDVGCGDHEVLRGIPDLPNYVGIDVSRVIIDRNRQLFPHRRFECVDFLDYARLAGQRSDVVLCLEVLIHQHRREQYDGFVANLVATARQGGLVSGYVADPRPAISSEIIAWHEPVTESLMRAGAKTATVEARSLETDCLAFVSFTA